MKTVDLFCGAGGFSEGFKQAGAEVLGGIDHDPDACASYAFNFPQAEAVCGDIREKAKHELLLTIGKNADVVIGGPPCQAFSQMRNHARLIDDPRNALYREFVQVVKKLEPKAFAMENVPGLDQMGVRQQILRDLSLGGSYVVTASLVDAADFGVPQTRKRVVFIGLHKDLKKDPPRVVGTGAASALRLVRYNSDSPSHYELEEVYPMAKPLLDQLRDPDDLSVVTAEQAIGDLVSLEPGRRETTISSDDLPEATTAYQRKMRSGARKLLCNVSVPRINADTALRVAGLPPGGNYRDLSEKLQERYLTGLLWGPHNGSGKLGRRHFYAYRRLHSGIWSWTLNTKGDSVYHYSRNRSLSVREFARLQSFSDRFAFRTHPTKGEMPGRIEGGAAHSEYRQVGNAVPPLLARAIAVRLRKVLEP